MARIVPNGHEVHFGEEEIIVSKTDLKGLISYANSVFLKVSGFTEAELLGRPHNLIRHPDMPACVFQLMWDTLQEKREIFAYVVNLAKNGSAYWVFAHVTPSFNLSGEHVGYHSNRRVPYPDALPAVKALYGQLSQVERRYANRREAIQASSEVLRKTLASAGMTYSQFVFSLSKSTNPTASVAA
jgi:PAS domain S-box-containing protein